MVGEGLQNYVSMVTGLTKTTKAKAAAAAKALLAQTGLDEVAADASERVSKLADEIVAASKANRELLQKMVETEVDKAADRLGFARAEEVDALRRDLAELRLGLAHQSAHPAGPTPPAGTPPETPTPTPEPAPAASAPVRKAPVRKAPVRRAPVKEAATTTAPAKKATAEKAPAKKAPAKKAAAKKAATASTPATGSASGSGS